MLSAEKFAEVYLTAQDIREASWRKEEARYSVTYQQAAETACESLAINAKWIPFVYLLMIGTWNDAADYAKSLHK